MKSDQQPDEIRLTLSRATIYIRGKKITTPQELEEALKKLEEEEIKEER